MQQSPALFGSLSLAKRPSIYCDQDFLHLMFHIWHSFIHSYSSLGV